MIDNKQVEQSYKHYVEYITTCLTTKRILLEQTPFSDDNVCKYIKENSKKIYECINIMIRI